MYANYYYFNCSTSASSYECWTIPDDEYAMLNSDNDEQGEGNKDMVRGGRRRKRMGHMVVI